MPKHGIFGYSEVQTPYFEILANWPKKHHNWDVQEKWLIKTPGVVFAFAMAEKSLKMNCISEMIIAIISIFKILKRKLFLKKSGCLFFSPHNPVVRVWTAEELVKLGDICVKYGVIVVSDEIHADFVFKGRHHVFASLKKFVKISITCTSPSKTFNLASMMMSNIFIPNHELKRKFRKELDAAGTS